MQLKQIFSIVGLLSLLSSPVMAIAQEYQTNTGDRPTEQIAKSNKEKEAKEQRNNETGKRRAYRERQHLELDRDLNEAMKLPRYRNMSQKDKEKLMRNEHDKLDKALDKKWGYYD
ncbi:MAG: hypothetical protein ACRDB1_09630 [Microcoleaceae cyanobacterium]